MFSSLSVTEKGEKDLEGWICWCLRLGLAETVGHRSDGFIVAFVQILASICLSQDTLITFQRK